MPGPTEQKGKRKRIQKKETMPGPTKKKSSKKGAAKSSGPAKKKKEKQKKELPPGRIPIPQIKQGYIAPRTIDEPLVPLRFQRGPYFAALAAGLLDENGRLIKEKIKFETFGWYNRASDEQKEYIQKMEEEKPSGEETQKRLVNTFKKIPDDKPDDQDKARNDFIEDDKIRVPFENRLYLRIRSFFTYMFVKKAIRDDISIKVKEDPATELEMILEFDIGSPCNPFRLHFMHIAKMILRIACNKYCKKKKGDMQTVNGFFTRFEMRSTPKTRRDNPFQILPTDGEFMLKLIFSHWHWDMTVHQAWCILMESARSCER